MSEEKSSCCEEKENRKVSYQMNVFEEWEPVCLWCKKCCRVLEVYEVTGR
jgi:hypothetical protein